MHKLDTFVRSEDFKLLYVARHVHEDQQTAPPSSGQYPIYHRESLTLLEAMACDVVSADNEVDLQDHITRADYVFSLMNRVRMKNSDVLVSTLCEYA